MPLNSQTAPTAQTPTATATPTNGTTPTPSSNSTTGQTVISLCPKFDVHGQLVISGEATIKNTVNYIYNVNYDIRSEVEIDAKCPNSTITQVVGDNHHHHHHDDHGFGHGHN